MELDREYIKKDLEISGGLMRPLYPNTSLLLKNALAIITADEQKIFALENRLKECENGYEGTLALERAKIKELTEVYERLKHISESYMLQYGTAVDKEVFLKNERADTVRKMQERLIAEIENTPNANEFFITAWRTKIDQIAKEILEGAK